MGGATPKIRAEKVPRKLIPEKISKSEEGRLKQQQTPEPSKPQTEGVLGLLDHRKPTKDQTIDAIISKVFDLLHHHKWTLEMSCLAAIERTLQALDDAAPESLARPTYTHELALLHRTKFEYTDDISDLQAAVVHAENAVKFTEHPERATHLSTLVEILLLRYKWCRNFSDLNQGILYAKTPIAQMSLRNLDKVTWLLKLIDLLEMRYEVADDVSDLENALSLAVQAELESRNHPSRIACLSKLSDLSFEKFKWRNTISDLNLAVTIAERVVDEIAEDHPDHPIYLYKLLNLLSRKQSQVDQRLSLEMAILSTSQEVPRLWGNADLRGLLESEVQFEKLELIPDYDKLNNALLMEIKAPAPQSPSYLSRNADILFEKFRLHRNLIFLRQAISKAERAVAETHPSQPSRIIYLHKLVALLIARFKETKDIDDLDETIFYIEEILTASQESSDRAAHFLMLGDILVEKFNLTSCVSGLGSAIQRVRMAIVESKVGSLHRVACLSELACIHLLQFEQTQNPDDVTKATAYRERAISEAAMARIQDAYLSKKPTTVAIRTGLVDDLADHESSISRSQRAVLVEDFRDSDKLRSKLQSIAGKKRASNRDHGDLDIDISNEESNLRTKRDIASRMASQSKFAVLLLKRFWIKKDRSDLRLAMTLLVDIFVYEWACNGQMRHLEMAISHIKFLVESDLIILPRAAILLGLEPRPEILRILDKAIVHPDDLVEMKSMGIKKTQSCLKSLSIAVALGFRKGLPRFDATEILSVWEHAPIGSVKLGLLIAGSSSSKKRTYDPLPSSEIKTAVINHLEDATPDEDWESLRTKVFDKNTRRWKIEYKAQTVKLFDDDTFFAQAYSRPETRAWLGESEVLHLVTGYQTCVSENLMKRVAAKDISARDAAKRGRIFSIMYVNVVL